MLTGSTSGEFTAWNGLMFNFEIFPMCAVPLLANNRETFFFFLTSITLRLGVQNPMPADTIHPTLQFICRPLVTRSAAFQGKLDYEPTSQNHAP
jgi:hypothetical protein